MDTTGTKYLAYRSPTSLDQGESRSHQWRDKGLRVFEQLMYSVSNDFDETSFASLVTYYTRQAHYP